MSDIVLCIEASYNDNSPKPRPGCYAPPSITLQLLALSTIFRSSNRPPFYPSTKASKPANKSKHLFLYFLQQNLLRALFYHFACVSKLEVDVRVGVAFLVAYALDLVRDAGRQSAKYLRTFTSTVVVNDRDVVECETNMQTQVFDRVWASILVDNGKRGGLFERLSNLGMFSFRLPLRFLFLWISITSTNL
jgi:hypothetical protein